MIRFFTVRFEEKYSGRLECSIKDFIKIKHPPFIIENTEFVKTSKTKITSTDEVFFSGKSCYYGILVYIPAFFLKSTGRVLKNGTDTFILMKNGETLVLDSPGNQDYYFMAVDGCLKRILVVD